MLSRLSRNATGNFDENLSVDLNAIHLADVSPGIARGPELGSRIVELTCSLPITLSFNENQRVLLNHHYVL